MTTSPPCALSGILSTPMARPGAEKSHLHANIKMPLQAIVFLKQAKENKIRRLTNKEAVQMLVYQSLRPDRDTEKMEKLLSLLDRLLARTPVYQLDCTVSHEAVKVVYNEINKAEKEGLKVKIKADYILREVAGTHVVVPHRGGGRKFQRNDQPEQHRGFPLEPAVGGEKRNRSCRRPCWRNTKLTRRAPKSTFPNSLQS